jgi:hypothetical protein
MARTIVRALHVTPPEPVRQAKEKPQRKATTKGRKQSSARGC